MVFVIGGTLAFFFEFLLLSKKNKSLADKLLATWMFLLGLHLFLYYFTYFGLDFKYPHLLGIGIPFPLVHGPMLLLYTAALTGKLTKWKSWHFLHFLPFVFFYIYYLHFFFLPAAEKLAYVERLKSGEIKSLLNLLYPGMVISAIIYLFFTLILYLNFQKRIKNYFSYSNEKINLHWLRNLLTGLTIVWIVVIIANSVFKDFRSDVAIYVTVTLFVVSIGYYGIKQGNIFTSPKTTNETISEDQSEVQENVKRYSKSGLTDDKAIKIASDLSLLMHKKKSFLDEKLSLPKLASELEILPNYLSQVINERYGMNFYDYINKLRVEEFKNLATQPKLKNMTILTVAYESGFSSKGAFNNAFKKFEGQTPSEYLKSINN